MASSDAVVDNDTDYNPAIAPSALLLKMLIAMSPSLIASKAVSMALLFPGNLLLLLALSCIFLWRGYRRTGTGIILVSMLCIIVLSMPVVSYKLLSELEDVPVLTPAALDQGAARDAQAIVVLAGGVLYRQPEFGGINTTAESSLLRIRYGAYLHKHTGLPILVSGGVPVNGESSGQTMANDLHTFFATPVQWVEGRSENTAENAQYSWDMLKPQGIQTILLVTSASHMRRAIASYQRVGFTVIPAPTVFQPAPLDNLLQYLPKLDGLNQSNTVLHEWIGALWYRIAE